MGAGGGSSGCFGQRVAVTTVGTGTRPEASPLEWAKKVLGYLPIAGFFFALIALIWLAVVNTLDLDDSPSEVSTKYLSSLSDKEQLDVLVELARRGRVEGSRRLTQEISLSVPEGWQTKRPIYRRFLSSRAAPEVIEVLDDVLRRFGITDGSAKPFELAGSLVYSSSSDLAAHASSSSELSLLVRSGPATAHLVTLAKNAGGVIEGIPFSPCVTAPLAAWQGRLLLADCDEEVLKLKVRKTDRPVWDVLPDDAQRPRLTELFDLWVDDGRILLAGRLEDGSGAVLERSPDSGWRSLAVPAETDIYEVTPYGVELLGVGLAYQEGGSIGVLCRWSEERSDCQRVQGTRVIRRVAARDGHAAILARSYDRTSQVASLELDTLGQAIRPSYLNLEAGEQVFDVAAWNGQTLALVEDATTGLHAVKWFAAGKLKDTTPLLPDAQTLVESYGIHGRAKARWELLMVTLGALLFLGVGYYFFRPILVTTIHPRARRPLLPGNVLTGLVIRAELEIWLQWRKALLLLSVGGLLGALGIGLFFVLLEPVRGETTKALRHYYYLRAGGVLFATELIAFYFLRLFGRSVSEYKAFYRIFLDRASFLAAKQLLEGGTGELDTKQRSALAQALVKGLPEEEDTESAPAVVTPEGLKALAELAKNLKPPP